MRLLIRTYVVRKTQKKPFSWVAQYEWITMWEIYLLTCVPAQSDHSLSPHEETLHPWLSKMRTDNNYNNNNNNNNNNFSSSVITCEKCYCLCVLRWLIRPILALNCLLQMKQQRSEQDSSVGDALALALRCACFCSASLFLFASYSLASLLMRPRHFTRSCAICSHDSVGMLKSLRKALRVSFYRFFWPP